MQNREISGSPASEPRGWLARSLTLHIILIILIGFLAYSNTFGTSFHLDDEPNIVNNPYIKDLGHFAEPLGAGKVTLPGAVAISWKSRIVGYLSFALNYRLGGADVRGYHAVNLAIHLINALLLYWLVLVTIGTPRLKGSALQRYSSEIALFSGLIFVSHPIETQAVTYIVQRLASLAALFYLLSLCCYAKARLAGSKPTRYAFYAASLVSATLAMKTKEIAFTLPVMVVLYDLLFLEGRPAARLRYLIPMLLTMAIIPLSLLGVNRPVGEIIGEIGSASRLQSDLSRPDYLFTQFRAIATYLRLLALPVNQNLDYDYPVFHSFFAPQVMASFAGLLGVAALGVIAFLRSKREPALRLVAFGIFWFFIAISVESSVIPIADVMFEHRVYLPSAGVFAAVIAGAFMLKEKFPRARKAVAPALLAVVVAFTAASYARNAVWKDEMTLWEDTVKKSPAKPRPHNNLGLAYDAAGRSEKAVEQFTTAMRLSSYYDKAATNLGVALLSMGKPEEAVEYFTEALGRDPENGSMHYNLGFAYQQVGKMDEAIEHYERAASLASSHDSFADLAYNNLGVIYLSKGDTANAIKYLDMALSRDPYNSSTYNNLGNTYSAMGLTEKAIESYAKAVGIKPDYALAQYNLGSLYGKTGRLEEAEEHLLAAVKARPDYSMAHTSLGNVYLLSGDYENAVKHFELAIKSSPGNYEAHYNLAVTYKQMGLEDKSREYFRLAEELKKASIKSGAHPSPRQ